MNFVEVDEMVLILVHEPRGAFLRVASFVWCQLINRLNIGNYFMDNFVQKIIHILQIYTNDGSWNCFGHYSE